MSLLLRRRMMLASSSSSNLYEAYNLSFNGSNYINTGVYLFTAENLNRDFEFVADGIYSSVFSNENTIVCAKQNTLARGFLIRTSGTSSIAYNGTIAVYNGRKCRVVVTRINGVISCSGDITNPGVNFTNAEHDLPLVLGCALQDNGTPYRFTPGTIDYISVRWL